MDELELLVEGDEDRFVKSRPGDFLMTPFQCEVCHFRNITKRDVDVNSEQDINLIMDIRHANINANWSRETSTVLANLSQVQKIERIGRDFYGLASVTPPLGPFPLEDTFGMKLAVVLLRRSLDPGRNEEHIQFVTARKFRSAFSNAWHASKNVSERSAMAFEASKSYSTTCPTYGYWFERFMLGCHKRMGDKVVQDVALSKEIFLMMISHLEEDWEAARNDMDRDAVCEFATILITGFLCGLRGEEIMKMDISGLLRYIETGAQHREHPHVVVALVGRLKGEMGERYHMIILARVTQSGIKAGVWMDRLCSSLKRRDRLNGFVFRNKGGRQRKIGSFDPEFHERLNRVRDEKPRLFEPNQDITDAFSLRRSLRRGSTTEARNKKVRDEVVEMNNRWRKWETARGRMPSLGMAEHYTDIKLSLPMFWEYSHSF